MDTRSINFKSDFLVRLMNEVDWSTPFSIRFFTTRAVSAKVVAFDGENYVGCTLDENTGALLVPFERFTELYRQGLGTLRMELTYRLSNALYPDQYQDVVLPAQPVVCTNDQQEEFYLSLGLTGDDDVEVSASVVAPFMVGPQGAAGTGISTMVQTSASMASAGANVWKMTLTDGREFSFTVLNGEKGDTGAQGPQGPQGAKGAKGDKGDKGDTGARGPQGEQGPRGVPGQRGEKGAKGDKGDRGLTGESGPAGYTPEIGQNGNWWVGGTDTGVKADYSGTEAQRQATFEANEADRQEEFDSKEATRDAANQAALDCAETLAALGPKIEQIEGTLNGSATPDLPSVYKELNYTSTYRDIQYSNGALHFIVKGSGWTNDVVCGLGNADSSGYSNGKYNISFDTTGDFKVKGHLTNADSGSINLKVEYKYNQAWKSMLLPLTNGADFDISITDAIEDSGDNIANVSAIVLTGITESSASSPSVTLNISLDVYGVYSDKQTGGLVQDVQDLKSGKQDTLVSGTTIKTINGNSVLGEGDIEIPDASEYMPKQEKNIEGNITPPDGVTASGYYITQSGSPEAYAPYHISQPIELEKGDVLTFPVSATSATYLAEYEGNYTHFTPILYAGSVPVNSTITYTAEEDITVVISGSKAVTKTYSITSSPQMVKAASEESVTSLEGRVETLESAVGASIKIFNPYDGMDFNTRALANSHEHCFDAERLGWTYARGVKIVACSHYQPAAPRYPFSHFVWQYEDWDTDGVTKVTKTLERSYPTITVNGETIDTDTIPQIANAEHPIIAEVAGHYNILGLLFAEPGHDLTVPEGETKRDHAIVSLALFNSFLNDETKWQFGSALAFGTINHSKYASVAKTVLDTCPNIFKAMELFNQGYGKHWNQSFKDAYDSLLSQGYRIWGTAVVDWQNDWATWTFCDATDKAEWQAKYDALSSEDKAQYADAEAYYMAVGRYQFDRGMNMLLMPHGFDSMQPQVVAREAIKAYVAGRYYMVGTGSHWMQLGVSSGVITFRVSDIAPRLKVVTANGTTDYTAKDTIQYAPSKSDKFVRFEAEWDDGDFVYSNPCWIE